MKEKCPTCEQEKKLYKCFIDAQDSGKREGFNGYGCKDCLHESLIEKYGKEDAQKWIEILIEKIKEQEE